jgi:flagellar motor switch protein FliN/FliY
MSNETDMAAPQASEAGRTAAQAEQVNFPEVAPGCGTGGDASSLERVFGLTVPVSVELGRTSMNVEDILRLGPGWVVELDHPADAPVDLYVHGKRVAKGEIVVVDDFYGVRITSVGESDK